MCGGGRAHAFGRIEAKRHGSRTRLGLVEPRQRPGRPAGLLRLEVPERAVERIAGSARRQRVPQRLPGNAALDRFALALDRHARPLRRLVVTRVGDCLAPPRAGTVRDLGDDDAGLRLGAAGDAKSARERPRLQAHGEAPAHEARSLENAVGDRAHAGADRIDAGQVVGRA